VVFVHDWGESRIDMLACLEPWDDLCGRLVLYDLRGHGDATGGGSRLGHGEDQDLLGLLDRLGDGPFVLVGRAMGAAIAICAAARVPRTIDIAGVVTCRSRAGFHQTLPARLRAGSFPARPLADLAQVWLWLGGIRRVDVERAGDALHVSVLDIEADRSAVTPAQAREFLSRCAAQTESPASASSSGPR
jgi:pimeloyl-ACP methyl ester carboxylesterase